MRLTGTFASCRATAARIAGASASGLPRDGLHDQKHVAKGNCASGT